MFDIGSFLLGVFLGFIVLGIIGGIATRDAKFRGVLVSVRYLTQLDDDDYIADVVLSDPSKDYSERVIFSYSRNQPPNLKSLLNRWVVLSAADGSYEKILTGVWKRDAGLKKVWPQQ